MLGCPEPTSRPCSGQKPQETRGTPTSFLREAPFCHVFAQAAQDSLPRGVSHTRHLSRAEATCDSVPATAGVFADYLVIWTLARKAVNLLASPAENVSFKMVSLAFQATALISRTEDNWRKTDASFIPVEKAALFCKKNLKAH